jgi:hypothetical protein
VLLIGKAPQNEYKQMHSLCHISPNSIRGATKACTRYNKKEKSALSRSMLMQKTYVAPGGTSAIQMRYRMCTRTSNENILEQCRIADNLL